MCVLLISLANNDFQIKKCTIILLMDERLCYALSILSITYLPLALINSLVSTGDTGRQPPLLPPLRAAI